MERVRIEGTDLEYEVRGAGEPVVLVHGSILADGFAPLLAEPALTGRHRLLSYHRRGFAGSSRPEGPVSIGEQAADCRALMQHLGISRAHIVGHSYGGVIALQLALDTPKVVQSLALLEPALLAVSSASTFLEAMGPVVNTYAEGNRSGAVDAFLKLVNGPDYRGFVDRVLPPGAFDLAVADADTFFKVELPALQQWNFTAADAKRIRQPVLAVLGAESPAIWPGFREGHELVKAWLPQAEPFLLQNATHGLQMMNSRGLADALAGFFARYPLPAQTGAPSSKTPQRSRSAPRN